jgi:hypothetical protein
MTKIGTCSYKNNFVVFKNIFNPQLVQLMGGDPIDTESQLYVSSISSFVMEVWLQSIVVSSTENSQEQGKDYIC